MPNEESDLCPWHGRPQACSSSLHDCNSHSCAWEPERPGCSSSSPPPSNLPTSDNLKHTSNNPSLGGVKNSTISWMSSIFSTACVGQLSAFQHSTFRVFLLVALIAVLHSQIVQELFHFFFVLKINQSCHNVQTCDPLHGPRVSASNRVTLICAGEVTNKYKLLHFQWCKMHQTPK